MTCKHCDDSGWVCENHPNSPWGGTCTGDNACDCGAGAPCPSCYPERACDVVFNPLHWRCWLWIYPSASGGTCVWFLGRLHYLPPRKTRWWAQGR